jgi:hypothetical protein
MRKAMHDDFISVTDGVISPDQCIQAIEIMDRFKSMGFFKKRHQIGEGDTTMRDDLSLSSNNMISEGVEIENISVLTQIAMPAIYNAYNQYATRYGSLNSVNPVIFSPKMQITNVSEGYHVWHFEDGARSTSGRLLAYILYLNDVEEGGETEFLYVSKRVKPKAGRLLMFPAGFTHTHRGNPPLSGVKYILTGWVEL